MFVYMLFFSATMALVLPSSPGDDTFLQLMDKNTPKAFYNLDKFREDKLRELQETLLSLSYSVTELSNENIENLLLVVLSLKANPTIFTDLLNENPDILQDVLRDVKDIGSEPDVIPPTPGTMTPEEQLQGKDCAELYSKGERASGKYIITPFKNQKGFEVSCDMDTDGGGWTVFQRRGSYGNPKDYFYKTWNEYKEGFGDVTAEFWIGNDRLSALTQGNPNQLRVDLWDLDGNQVHAKYSNFRVETEQLLYKLNVSGYSGNAGDSLTYSCGSPFTTRDRKNDDHKRNCAVVHQGAWWYNGCTYSNLNGLNLQGFSDTGTGIFWFYWRFSYYSMPYSEMKIRPIDF